VLGSRAEIELSEQLRLELREALAAFQAGISVSGWRGREREAVSHFAFSYLVPQCRPGAVIHEPGQIGIEVAVPGVLGLNPKTQVCKDVVIWQGAGQTCWDDERRPTRAPLAILEWKCHRSATPNDFAPHDVEWLKAFTAKWHQTIGILVQLGLARNAPRLRASMVEMGEIDESWLTLPGTA
jgi:hypothetical protein